MDIDALLDPEVREAITALPPMGLTAENLARVRAARAADWELVPLSDEVERREVLVPGPAGAPDVAVRVHRPKGVDGALPCVYWMHGGGMVIGSARQDDQRFDRWCVRHRCVGVAVEYRLAPETPYPGPLEDCYAGLRWLHAHAAELDVDADRIGIGGASAGGGLAAGLALLARDRGEVPVAFQLLVYPMIDDRRITVSSRWNVPIWNPSANEFGWAAYLGGLSGDDVPAYAAPARSGDVRGLPRALVVVGALDGFLDEDVTYAQRLLQAGVPVELHVYPGAPHGFDGFAPDAAVARQCRRDTNAWLARVLAG
jgi:acetyl esterase/lipase